MKKIIVIAGTVDARQIAKKLIETGMSVIATVATGYGKELLNEREGIDVREGRLNAEELEKLIEETAAECLVDASHPYAKEISINAMEACGRLKIAYVRYERPETEKNYTNLIPVRDYEEAAKTAAGFPGNIFLTVGSNHIECFAKHTPDYKNRLYARVLPESGVLAKCEAAGLNANNIIALKGPFSEELNIQMLKHVKASVLVTKDSGDAGGTEEKIRAAEKLRIPVIMIRKPQIVYPNQVNRIEAVLDFVKRI
ncbi:MAG: cobalt-precorrin-6A reductase [Clostridia bacterium]|nr:cobalt-precorrin-6A reductase [Clostridia bacterium]